MVALVRLLRHRGGAAAAEFSLVLPLLLLFIFGIIDCGRFMWTVNLAEKATQEGTRYAVVTSPVASAIATTDFVGVDGLGQGDRIPASELPTITCTSSSCTGCSGAVACTYNATAFNNIVARMKIYYPAINAANVIVQYSGSGIGFAGDPLADSNWPNHPQIQPLVTVKLQSLTFKPVTGLLLATISLPSFSTTLSAEDLSGTHSN